MFGGRPCVTNDMAGGAIEGGDMVATAAAAILFVFAAAVTATGTGTTAALGAAGSDCCSPED
jgi:hypothetical protein